MFNIRDEGEQIKNGFNFYPLRSTNSFGFIFRLNNKTFWLRYSKTMKKITCRIITLDLKNEQRLD